LGHYKESVGYTAYLNGSVKRKLINYLARKFAVYSYLDKLYSQQGYEAIGFKFMYAQASRIPWRYPMVIDYIRGHDVRVIHLVRNNSLRVLVSRQRLRASGIPHSKVALPANAVVLPVNTLYHDLENLESEKQRWRGIREELPFLEITYEQLILQRDLETRRVLEFLGVNADAPLNSPLKKIGSDSLKEAIANYEEVEKVLRGTRFEELLD